MTQTAHFWDKLAEGYAKSPIRDQESYEYTLGRTRSYLSPEDAVLEIGGGTGSTALLLAPYVAHITGTDISPKMTHIATEKAQAQGSGNADFRVQSAREAVADASRYNVVLAFNILHLTEDSAALLARLSAELKPGSLFISKTPCLSEPSIGAKRHLFRLLIPLLRAIGKAPFVKRFSFADLEAEILAAGFEIVETDSRPAMSRYIVARRP